MSSSTNPWYPYVLIAIVGIVFFILKLKFCPRRRYYYSRNLCRRPRFADSEITPGRRSFERSHGPLNAANIQRILNARERKQRQQEQHEQQQQSQSQTQHQQNMQSQTAFRLQPLPVSNSSCFASNNYELSAPNNRRTMLSQEDLLHEAEEILQQQSQQLDLKPQKNKIENQSNYAESQFHPNVPPPPYSEIENNVLSNANNLPECEQFDMTNNEPTHHDAAASSRESQTL